MRKTSVAGKFMALFVVCVLIASLTLAGCSTKGSSSEKTSDKKTLTVGLCAMYPPFESLDDDNETIVGFDIDLANEIAKEMGVELKFVNSAWDGLAAGLEKGDYDFLQSAMTPKELGDANVDFSDPYFKLNDVVVVQKGNPEKIASVDDLKGKVIGTQTGSSASEAVDKIEGIAENRHYEYTQDAIADLNAGRIDAVVAGEAFLAEQAAANEGEFDVLSDVIIDTAPLCAVFNKGDDLRDRYNEALKKVMESDAYDKLVAKYFPDTK